jgi:hypothetical protein
MVMSAAEFINLRHYVDELRKILKILRVVCVLPEIHTRPLLLSVFFSLIFIFEAGEDDSDVKKLK